MKNNRFKALFIILFLINITFNTNAKVLINKNQDNRISISNKGEYSKTVIIYVLARSDSSDKWVRIGNYYLQSGHTIGFLIESFEDMSNYAFKVQGDSGGIIRFSTNDMKFE